jgi:hypothetical protein
MKIALVYEYLTQRGEAEGAFELLCPDFPLGNVSTSLYKRDITVYITELKKNLALRVIFTC